MPSEMTTFLSKALNYIILVTVLGSVMCDSNLKTFCSNEFFDKIITKRNETTNRLDIRFYRIQEFTEKRYNLWNATLIHNKNTNYYTLSDISYGWQNEPIPDYQLQQPKECPFPLIEPEHSQLTDFWLKNRDNNTTIMVYPSHVILPRPHNISQYNRSIEVKNTKDLFMTALICDASEDPLMFYVIGEKRELMNDKNRTQFVGELSLKNEIRKQNGRVVSYMSATFIRLTNLSDFLSLDCSLKPLVTPEGPEDRIAKSMTIYWIIGGVLILLFVIFVFFGIIWVYRVAHDQGDSQQAKSISISTVHSSGHSEAGPKLSTAFKK